jgi:hypothetical protein
MVAHRSPDVLFPAVTWTYVAAAVIVLGSGGSPALQPRVRLTPAVDGFWRLSVSNTCQSFEPRLPGPDREFMADDQGVGCSGPRTAHGWAPREHLERHPG